MSEPNSTIFGLADAANLTLGGRERTLLSSLDVEHTHTWGVWLGRQLRAGDLVILVGELGAGKTALTQGIADGLHVRGPITSPTFTLSRMHPSLKSGPVLLHIDAYRLQGPADIDDLDIDSWMPQAVTVVEWGEGMVEHLSDSALTVRLERSAAASDTAPGADEPRLITVEARGPRWIS